MLLDWLGMKRGDERLIEASRLIERAIDATLSQPESRTRDLGGQVGTRAFTRILVERIGELGQEATAA
jgi:3-isopropylmalate dehydrogenase